MKFVALLCWLFAGIASMAQSTEGITKLYDSSFTTFSAYTKAIKKYPGIEIVQEYPLLNGVQQRDIVYCSIGNRQLVLDAFLPQKKDSSLSTAIIILHGGGWRSGSRKQHYPLAQKLCSLGYTCFAVEYRLSTEAHFPAGVHDVKAAIRWAKKNATVYNIDTNKIVALGFSAGGEMAAFVGTTGNKYFTEKGDCNMGAGNVVNAIIDIDGILSFVHPESGEGDDSKKTSSATYWLGSSKNENPTLWQDASPLTWVGASTPPTLFINSAEKRMHAGQEDYIKVLNGHSIYSKVYEFENSPHTFCLFHPWFEPTTKYIDQFLKIVFKQ